MSTKLPKEVYALAKSMGLDLKDLEPEAQDIWRMLNDMQSNDPLQYESFIRSTIDENKDLLNNKENGNFTSMNSNGSQSADDPSAQPMIRPTASFAIISRTCGGDGIKIRESSNDGKVLYINVCSHIGIQRPVDDFGKVMEGDVLHNTNSAEIPMIIGQPRDDKISLTTKADGIINECIVIDVLVNPSVTNTTKLNQPFRRDLVELIFKSIESETIVRINSSFSWEISKRSYECGRGEERLVPALFPVKNPTEKPPKQNDTMQDPKNLFDSVLKERTKFESDINISIDKNIMAVNGREVDGCKESTLKPVNNARINEGDSEKDVLSSNNADEIRKNLEFKKGFLSNKPSKSIPDHSSAEARQKLPSSKDNYEIDALFKSIDGEWSQEVRSGNDTMQEDSSDIEKILKVKVLTSRFRSTCYLRIIDPGLGRDIIRTSVRTVKRKN